MSAGAFINTFVAAITLPGRTFRIRTQPETIAAIVTDPNGQTISNTPSAGPASEVVSANVSGSTRRRGFHVSIAYLSVVGTPPAGYATASRTVIPILNSNFFVAAATSGSVVSYLGASWRIVGVRIERFR